MDSNQPVEIECHSRAELQNKIIVLDIVLNGSSPAIWRRFSVPAAYTFGELSYAITEVMGWSGQKQHEFQMMYPSGAGREILFVPKHEISSKETFEQRRVIDEDTAAIADYFSENTSTATYLYDFMDNWQHTIGFVELTDAEDQEIYPICDGGVGTCPPENIGGIYGYRRVLHILSLTQHPEHDETKWRLANLHNGQNMLHNTEYDPQKAFSSWIVY